MRLRLTCCLTYAEITDMGKEKAQQIMVCLCIHTCMSSKRCSVNKNERSKQEGGGAVGL